MRSQKPSFWLVFGSEATKKIQGNYTEEGNIKLPLNALALKILLSHLSSCDLNVKNVKVQNSSDKLLG